MVTYQPHDLVIVGSNPLTANRRYRITVNTLALQARNTGSIPVSVK
jgi:hypothetical protein